MNVKNSFLKVKTQNKNERKKTESQTKIELQITIWSPIFLIQETGNMVCRMQVADTLTKFNLQVFTMPPARPSTPHSE